MTGLPEKIRRTLEKIVADMKVKENIYGIGLFGSWSRSDATPSSDVDLLFLDIGSFNNEYVERIETNGLLIDLDHIPKQWIHGPVPPEIDQKLYEMQILYDRDWSLNNMKLLMAKSYSSPERVDIRTEAFVVESDIYLSRATSAFAREDFRSTQLFATVALENILKVLVEIAQEPLSNSRFVEKVEVSTVKLGVKNLFGKFLAIAGLSKVDDVGAKEKLKLFKMIWDEMKAVAKQNSGMLESLHFRVKANLNYYLNPAFLQGVVMRTNCMIDCGKVVEACHYLNSIFLEIVENYVWFKSLIDGVKADYSVLMRSLEKLEDRAPKNYGCIVDFLGLSDVTRLSAVGTIEKTREIALGIRRERKVLIKNRLLKT